MLKIQRKPFISYLLDKIADHAFTNVHICTGYLGNKIKEFIGNGSKFGLSVTYSDENKPLGTGGALKNASSFLEREFLLLQGDTYNSIDLEKLARYYGKNKHKTLMVVSGNCGHANIFNTRIDMKTNRITCYSKDKKEIGSQGMNCVDIGTYIFDRDFLFKFFPDNKAFSLEEDVFRQLISDRSFYGYMNKEVFYDMGTPDSIYVLKHVLKS